MCARPANPELREEILKAATRIVEDCGPDCVTMRQVAEQVGYTPTTLYLYFQDKDAILMEVVTRGFADLADAMDAAGVGPTPLDTYRQRARGYVVWGVMHPGLYQLMFEWRIDARFTEEQERQVARGPQGSAAALQSAIEAGALKGIEDPASYGVAMWAACHGVTSLAASRRLVPEGMKAGAAEVLKVATELGDSLVNALLATHLA